MHLGFIPDAASLLSVARVAGDLRDGEPDKLRFIYVLDREYPQPELYARCRMSSTSQL